ncbi:MAG: carboxypeptidase regulatory-like domain-containing protein [Gemmatimonas sp.]
MRLAHNRLSHVVMRRWFAHPQTLLRVAVPTIATLAGLSGTSVSNAQGASSTVPPATVPTAGQPTTLRAEVIAGHVAGANGTPVKNAVVIATMAPERVTFTDTVDASGHYTLRIANGTGDYLVYISAPGFAAFRKRVTRAGLDSVFTVDAQLLAVVTQLTTIKVAARKATPQRASGGPIEAGAAERLPDALVGAISPDLAGDLNAFATLVPGITATPGGFSALGLGPTQNTVTLGGAQFPGTSLPRDTRTNTRVTTSTYDPARGWFSGANVNLELVGGGLFATSRGHLTVDAPALQSTDRLSRSAGQEFSNVRLSYGADGPVTWENKYFYNVGLQADRRSSDASSLMTVNPGLLATIGIAGDSTAALLRVLNGTNMPVIGTLPGSRISDNVSFLARLERTPVDMKTFVATKTTYGMTVIGQQSRDHAVGIGALSTPSRAGNVVQQTAALQGMASHFFGKDYLHETRSTLSWNDRNETSSGAQPEGRVLVQSDPTDSEAGFSTLLFGGNSAGNRRTRQLTWETINTTKFYANGRDAHAVKVTSDFRFDRYQSEVHTNPFGTFTYASLSDLSAGAPMSFSRTVNSPDRNGGAWNAFLAIGDNWRLTNNFQMMYGARLEGNVYTAHAPLNTALENTFGTRTDYAPASIHVSPRLGFTWVRSTASTRTLTGPSGQYSVPAPRYIRGGLGEFRNMLSPSLLAEPSVSTGLSTGQTRLSCIGDVTPVPDWTAYATNSANIPTQCAGAPTSVYSDGAPNVRLIGRGFRPPTSWRANLAYGSRNLKMDWSLEGIYSLNLHQSGTVDLNFVPTTRFTLADESRPVFVPTSAIFPYSGLTSQVGSRLSSNYGRVLSSQSDLRSVGRQVTLNVRPAPDYMRNWYASGSYTLSSNRSQSRGFDGVTVASPLTKEWGRSDFDVRHQFQSQFGYSKRGVTIAAFARVQSGLPYTPVVAGDVNGDGLSNDRAFIPNPAITSNAALASALNTLLENSSGSMRKCLQSQTGQLAGRNSCTTPWSMSTNAQISFAQRALKQRRISSIAINIANPLTAVDNLVHGSNNLHGWGSVNYPDANLLSVRGFNADTRQFQYAVNQRFGKPQQNSVLARAPFRLTLDISMDLARPVARQQLNQWLRPGRAGKPGPRLSRDDLKKRYERNVPDPFKMVLQDSDSLLVNRAQMEALQKAQIPYRAQLDSVWNALATALAALGDNFDDADVLKRQEAAVDRAWEITRQAVHRDVGPVLTRAQLSLLPGWVATLYRTEKPTPYRMYLAGPA